MERLGKPRRGWEALGLGEREGSESNPVATPIGSTAGSFGFAPDDSCSVSLYFRWEFADQVFDPFRFVPVANQNRVRRADDDQIVHSKQCNGCSIFLKHDVIAGIDGGNAAVCGVSAFILFKIIRHRSPAADIIPIKRGFYDQNAVGLFHDRVIERDSRQFPEALA